MNEQKKEDNDLPLSTGTAGKDDGDARVEGAVSPGRKFDSDVDPNVTNPILQSTRGWKPRMK